MGKDTRRDALLWTSEITNERIAAARVGPLESWTIIALNMNKIPLGKLTDVLKLFIPIFDVPDGFDPSAPLPGALKSRYERVELAIQGIAAVASRTNEDPDFLRVFSSSWSNILKWAQYYFNDKCTSALVDRESEAFALVLLISLFDIFSSTAAGYSKVRQGDVTFSLLAKIWLKSVPNTLIKASIRTLIMAQMHTVLQHALNSPSWSLSSARKIILREAGNKSSLVAKVALTALRDAPTFPRESTSFIMSSLCVLSMFLKLDDLEEDCSIFHQSLVDKHAIRLVILTMSYFSTPPNALTRMSEMAAGLCLELVGAFMGNRGAFALLPRIFKSGFLDTVADFIKCFHPRQDSPIDSSGQVLQVIIGRMFPTFLVHYPVLSAAIQATNSLILSKKINVFESSVIRSEWKLFFDSLLDRATVKALYDLMMKDKDNLICHNCGISSKKSGKLVSACAGCKAALYCSRECQKAAWNTKNHKLECEPWKEMGADKLYNLHATFFPPCVAAYDMRRHLPGILKLQALDPGCRNAGSDIAYSISYISEREPFIEISLFRASGFEDSDIFMSSGRPEIMSTRFQYAFEQYRNDTGPGTQMVQVTYYWGGEYSNTIFEGLPKSHFELPANVVIGTPAGKSNPRRRKALDKQGRELETQWDDVDNIMFKALQEDKEAKVQSRASINTTFVETVFDRVVRLAKELTGQGLL